jgi:hypothetical protein
MPDIGVLTSTVFGGPAGTIGAAFKTSFENGYRIVTGGAAPNYALIVEATGKYSADGKAQKRLYRGVGELEAAGADILVAVGGLVAAHAVVQRSDKPFLVLIGRLPESSDFSLVENLKFRGGVNLNTVHHNFQRRDRLRARFPTIAQSDVWLLYNPNSRIGKSEVNEWKAQDGRAMPAAIAAEDDPDGNDPDEFENAFKRLKKRGARGVVISADAFFTQHRNELVAAANTAATVAGGSMKMCYPFEIFGNATPPPSGGSGISIGPNLLSAYEELGKKAARLVAASNTFQNLDVQLVLPTDIVYS